MLQVDFLLRAGEMVSARESLLPMGAEQQAFRATFLMRTGELLRLSARELMLDMEGGRETRFLMRSGVARERLVSRRGRPGRATLEIMQDYLNFSSVTKTPGRSINPNRPAVGELNLIE